MSNEHGDQQSIRFRDYQLDALKRIFVSFGVEPAGPKDDPVVIACRSDGTGENRLHGGARQTLAAWSRDDVEPPF